ncbi:MAG: hypothetical protein GY714_18610 [Desulfobacterales bacterium]|nr:hypothetical protein [Desulfobacterales bacterium]MCP4160480.1 hypothetical protein [Deltaproteobacteria bacterium]
MRYTPQSITDDALESFEIVKSNPLIDIRGNYANLLLFNDTPVAIDWADCQGSIGRHLARSGQFCLNDELESLRYTLDGNLFKGTPISQLLYPALNLLAPGHYELKYHELPENYCYIDFEEPQNSSNLYDAFYPYDWTLLFTQPRNQINPDQVNRYINLIKDGKRPICIIINTERSRISYVLDGHHKILAYWSNTEPSPHVIQICRIGSPKLPIDTFDRYFADNPKLAEHYRKYGRDDA